MPRLISGMSRIGGKFAKYRTVAIMRRDTAYVEKARTCRYSPPPDRAVPFTGRIGTAAYFQGRRCVPPAETYSVPVVEDGPGTAFPPIQSGPGQQPCDRGRYHCYLPRDVPLENPALRPPTEALVEDFPITETLGEIPPRNAGPISVENRFHEQSIICRRASDMAFPAGKKILDPVPLVVA